MEYIKVEDTKMVVELERAALEGEVEAYLQRFPLEPVWVLSSNTVRNLIQKDDRDGLRFVLNYLKGVDIPKYHAENWKFLAQVEGTCEDILKEYGIQ